MEYGILAVLPPIIAIVFAMLTKDVLLSLFLGITFGALTLAQYNPFVALIKIFEVVFGVLGDGEGNVRVLLIVLFIGALIGLLQKSGGSLAFANWVGTKVKSRKGAQGLTWFMGLVIFFDDFFNSLTIGAVMRPVTDRFKISREKLAYILDSTAAPVCIMAPVSSWVAYIISLIAGAFAIEGITDKPFKVFIETIPYNFYAWAAIFMVVVVIFTKIEFGPMKEAEKRAMKSSKVLDGVSEGVVDDDIKNLICSDKGKVIDMIVPIVIMFGASIYFMLYTGGYFKGGLSIAEAFYETDSASALVYGIFLSVVGAVVLYKIRGTVSISESIAAIVVGMKSMFFAIFFMTLAWSIGTICGDLDTAGYLVSLLGDNVSGTYIPVLIFLLACFTAFCTGSSWGTYAIMIPISISMAMATDANLALTISAVLSGGVFGDHCSPLADTTILSSAGAGVDHMEHVRTQFPYAFTCGGCAAIGFTVAGMTEGPIVPLIVTGVVFVASTYLLNYFFGNKIEDETIKIENEATSAIPSELPSL